jgi:hypothetical protein
VPTLGYTEEEAKYVLHILPNQMNIRFAFDTHAMFLFRDIPILLYDEFLRVSAVLADKFKASLAFMNSIEFSDFDSIYISLN